jgi:flagellar hook-associated protein 2
MAISSPGVGSNLDVNSIVEKLMSVERQPLNRLASQQSSYQSKLSAYGTLQGALSAFQTAVQDLAGTARFSAQTATVSDSTILSASANANATPGSYTIEVRQLAQQQKLAVPGFASTSDTLGSGSLTIAFGTYDPVGNSFQLNGAKPATVINIPSGSNTLAGIRDAINAAGAGVTATVVNDGAARGNRLVITSKDSGAANSVRISVMDDDGNNTDASGLSQLAFDPSAAPGSGKNLSEVQTARDAILSVDGITVTKVSNVITDAIQGITLNLTKTNAGSTVGLSVAADSAAIKDGVASFVKAFNTINKNIRDLTAFDPVTKRGGALQGDSAPLSALSQMRGVLTRTVESAQGSTTLSQVGVSFQRDGTLALDERKLQAAIDRDLDGVVALFAATGRTADGQTLFAGSSQKTQPGSYAVAVSRLATSGSLAGSAPPNLSIASGVNDRVELSIDGAALGITLRPLTYASIAELAAELQTRITEAGGSALVSAAGGVLSLSSASFGTASALVLTGGNGASDLLGATPATTMGQDVAGTINGVSARGSGQTLVGAIGDASEGLALRVFGGPLGARGEAIFSRGYADQLAGLASSFLDSGGLLSTRTDGINSSIRGLGQRQEALETRLNQMEKRYRAQFTALDTSISSLQQTSSFLTQQLASLINSNRR